MLIRWGDVPYPAVVELIKVNLDKDWLSVADICDYMHVSAFVVTAQLRSGNLPAVKFGREWRIARQDFEDWINAQRIESTARARLDGRAEPAPAATEGRHGDERRTV